MSVLGREWAVDRAPTGATAAAQVLPSSSGGRPAPGFERPRAFRRCARS